MSILIAPSLLVFALPQLAWWLQCVAFSTLAILTLTVFRFWDDVDKALLLQLTDLVRSDRIQKQ
jgi:membrane protein implicated in regulation of membrane protease activity